VSSNGRQETCSKKARREETRSEKEKVVISS
jgi:hypothetical protein